MVLGATVLPYNLSFTNQGSFLSVSESVAYSNPGGLSSDLTLWLKADAGVTGGSDITSWADQSGNIFNATGPIAAQLMQMAISRKREYLADATGALLTRYPEGLASALEKISGAKIPMRKASHATAHLFISDPFAGGKRSVWQKVGGLFHTHPPAAERIARLRNMSA